MENLSAAVRSDFLVAWSALLRMADDTDMAVLAMHVDQLWKVVDDFAGAVQQGYLDQRLQMARTNIIEQQQSLSDLLSDEPSPTTVRRAAEVLGLDETAAYWVVGFVAEAAASAVTRRLIGRDVAALDHTSKGVTLMLLSAPRRWPDDETLAADLLSGVVGAVSSRTVKLQNVFRSA